METCCKRGENHPRAGLKGGKREIERERVKKKRERSKRNGRGCRREKREGKEREERENRERLGRTSMIRGREGYGERRDRKRDGGR